MSRIFTSISSLFQMAVAAGRWFYNSVINPVEDEPTDSRALAPIRYDGDPTDVYLA